ncbi:hypothetical protein IFM89_013842 [Coptis chinensis]|uniref:Organ-specific protein S2 n=1 Tax=Coptis chinensis TaxID=261450 RepID=A0A835MIA8_9MAGN|nr:hypothetical protein IFM89_013842 [Coptis chinensis]
MAKTMDSLISFFTLFLLILFASTINARKAPEEYWKEVMKDRPMPDAIGGLVNSNQEALSKHETKANCHGDAKKKEDKSFAEDFEPRPNLSVYDNDAENKEVNIFVKDLEPRPSATGYYKDAGNKEDKSFVKDSEPRPNVSVYHDDTELKEEKSFVKDFEPRPNLSVYNN